MSDLISREALLDIFEHKKDKSDKLQELIFFDAVMAIIDIQPIAYDVDKVTEQLDEIASNVADHEREYISEEEVYNLLLYFIEIVKGGGQE